MKPKMIIPMLVCLDVEAELDFCVKAFGAVELSRRTAENGNVIHATLMIHQSMLMLHNEAPHLASRAPQSDGSSSVVTYLYDDDVDGIMARAIALGASVLMPAEDQLWGDRVGRLMDPAAHVRNIAARIE
ncbi:VOC family protein, partial [Cellvibrio mixtus]|uniref:VOC family protein n=1 Tax=Cellvibrio mixtus TaxID=39650 RepID=UPI000586E2A0